MRAIKDLKESFGITWISGKPESLSASSFPPDDRKRPSSVRDEIKLEDREADIFERLKKKFDHT